MIADREAVHVQSNMTGKKVQMGFDENSLEHLMAVMTDLYSDEEAAIIREYSTNAIDSHVEAGVTRPIEVTTPTALHPYLTIKDFGVGMDAATIENVYSKYGASTKRGTNEQTGMLGLGCKSALTYTNQFSIIGVKDALATTVSVSRDDTGSHMTTSDPVPTDQPNGVTIVIPAKAGNRIEEKAREFFKFWQPGTVLLNGAEPERIDGLQVSDKLMVVDNSGYHYNRGTRTDYVVMGNVAYPIEQEFESGLSYGYNVVATVDIGTVNFTPSREALTYTAKTKATLKQIESDLAASIAQAIQAEVDKAGTKIEAIEALSSWRNILPSNVQPKAGSYTYQGKAIPSALKSGDNDPGFEHTSTTSHVLSRTSKFRSIEVGSWPTTLWVTNFAPDKYTASHKKKMNKYRIDNGLENLTACVMLRGAIPAIVKEWMPAEHIVDWSTVKAIKLPRQVTGQPNPNGIAQRLAGSYDFWKNGQFERGIAADEIDTSKPLFYRHGNRYETWQYAEVLQELHKGCTVVALSANRIEKFERDFPMAVEAMQATKDAAEAWKKKHVTGKNRIWFGLDDAGILDDFKAIEPSKVTDPELKAVAKIAKMDLTKLDKERNLLQRINSAGRVNLNGWKNPLKNYPLYSAYTMRQRDSQDHMYLYLNAAYEAASNGKAGV